MASVLAADDSATTRRMMAYALKGAGYEVMEAIDGRDALGKATASHADVVLADVHMPNMNGIELIRELRKLPQYATTPMLLLTVEPAADKRAQGRAAGATGWLVKPINPRQLLEVLDKLLA